MRIGATKNVRFKEKKLNSVRFKNSLKNVKNKKSSAVETKERSNTDPLALHGVSLGDGVRDREDLELVGVADHDDDVQAPARELKVHGTVHARCRAGDPGPRAAGFH